jgi:hypothetical protein
MRYCVVRLRRLDDLAPNIVWFFAAATLWLLGTNIGCLSLGQQGSPAQWALESLAILRAQVDRLPSSGEISATYIEPARAVIRTRLAQAGARLASLLNETMR